MGQPSFPSGLAGDRQNPLQPGDFLCRAVARRFMRLRMSNLPSTTFVTISPISGQGRDEGALPVTPTDVARPGIELFLSKSHYATFRCCSFAENSRIRIHNAGSSRR